MTKHIRIENADTSDHKVRVTVQHLMSDGTWKNEPVTTELNHPTAMTNVMIHSHRRVVVEEYIPS